MKNLHNDNVSFSTTVVLVEAATTVTTATTTVEPEKTQQFTYKNTIQPENTVSPESISLQPTTTVLSSTSYNTTNQENNNNGEIIITTDETSQQSTNPVKYDESSTEMESTTTIITSGTTQMNLNEIATEQNEEIENSASGDISTDSHDRNSINFYRIAVQNYKSAICYRSKVKQLNEEICRLQEELKTLREKCIENSVEVDKMILV